MTRRKKKKNKFDDMSEKANAQIEHARRRLLERYKIDVTVDEYLQICNFIKKCDLRPGKSKFVEKETNRVSRWLVNLEQWTETEFWIPVSYDKQRKRIVTFLPLEAIDKTIDHT